MSYFPKHSFKTRRLYDPNVKYDIPGGSAHGIARRPLGRAPNIRENCTRVLSRCRYPRSGSRDAGVSRRTGSSDTDLRAHRFPRGNHIHARLIEPLNPRVDWEPFAVTPRLQLFHSNQERLAQCEFQELRVCS
jgi:hypothetical protein